MNLFLPFILLFESMRSFIYVTLASLGLLTAVQGEPQLGAISNDLEFESTFSSLSEANLQERSQLLVRLDRNKGKWNANHPRHRLLDALLGFRNYRTRQNEEGTRLKELYRNVTKAQKKLLDSSIGYSTKFNRVDERMNLNQDVCDKIVQTSLAYYNISVDELNAHARQQYTLGRKIDKVSTAQTLKHFVRDWTDSGLVERDVTFPCLLDTLKKLVPDGNAKVLLPGSGLNRLAHEVAQLGFDVTANEWSTYMNVAYRYLESLDQEKASFHPFVDNWSHHAAESDMLRELQFPDTPVNPNAVVLVEGDFTTIFKHQVGEYDVILTYFFIDTARNLMSYFDTIKSLLKKGGYWINLGPLLYGTGPYVQLSLEEVVKVTEAMGFEYLDTDDKWGDLTMDGLKARGMRAVYSFNDRALTQSAYNAQFWVAQLK